MEIALRILEILVPIIVVILGSAWYADMRKQRAAAKKLLTKEDISAAVEESLQSSQTIANLHADIQHLAELQKESHDWHAKHQEETNDYRRMTLRQALFQPTTDRLMHEHQIECGHQYLELDGNGAGHIRLDQLEASYKYRLAHNDWDYNHTPPISKQTTK